MAEANWIKLNRKIWDCFIWSFENPQYTLAWIDMLLLANYKDKRIMFDGVVETVSRGSFITSMVKLSERWHMNRKTVKRFLDILQEDGMIVYECTRRRTSITIVNYDQFQSTLAVESEVPETGKNGSNEGTTGGTTDDTANGTQDGTSKRSPETIENTGFSGFDLPPDGQLNGQANGQPTGQPDGHQEHNSLDNNGTTLWTQHKKVKNIKESQESKESKKGKTGSLEASQNLLKKLIPDYTLPENLKVKMAEWIIYKAERREPYKEQGMKALLRKIENNSKEYGAQAVCDLIDECMASNWSGIIFDKLKTKQGGNMNADATNNGNSGGTHRYGNYI